MTTEYQDFNYNDKINNDNTAKTGSTDGSEWH